MKNFKEIIDEDLNIFFNIEEFCSELMLYDIKIKGILSELNEDKEYLDKSANDVSTYKSTHILILKKDELNILPNVEEQIEIDDIKYLINKIIKKDQVIEIYLWRIED